MPVPIKYANTQYISGQHTFKNIINGTNLSLNGLDNAPSCNVMTIINGNVGIGTTNPTQKLYVNGQIYATDNITAFSDIRFKTNIKKIENAIDKIKQINGYTFNRTDSEKIYMGVIAQEIETVFPEAIEKQGETLSVAYGNLIAPLIEVVKELIHEVDILKEKITLQNTDIENLKNYIPNNMTK